MNPSRGIIDSDKLITKMRDRIFNSREKKFLISDMSSSKEEKDEYTISNCDGMGRVRIFSNFKLHGGALDEIERNRIQRILLSNYPTVRPVKTQVFQLSGCTWRCWYCYVDENRLSGNPKYGKWLNCEQIIDLYLNEQDRPNIIDLSGGQPDLVPEWPILMLSALEARGLDSTVYLRSEDNLSNSLFRDILSDFDIERLRNYGKYSRIGCFKGFDESSFCFNTNSNKYLYARQFDVVQSIIDCGIDFYAYATFTGIENIGVAAKISIFLDRLQKIHHYLPLRTIILKIKKFSAWEGRGTYSSDLWSEVQSTAEKAWFEQMVKRYSDAERAMKLEDIKL
ncbi:hypothetical protein OX459_27305 [Janthinobacterium sp. SUN026]|uniref:radical SAM protein n=1 Tax=Janthinobacterium sp. SUN026 TaxID=3002438 RepID=UPI0025B16209|nr:radical SAM protein [Janthinobacterium sp. SUN026]MDN2675113.1 hypothetical protein [Janthinobacterium sp. SUN026]